jgi:predicted phosphodiesterase
VYKIAVYGDLHGQFGLIPRLRERNKGKVDEIVIAGDMGVGFPGPQDDNLKKYGESLSSYPRVRWIRGNHDDPAKCAEYNYERLSWIPDGTMEHGILYVGGAWSIDGPTGLEMYRNYRTPGLNWWRDEELTREQWDVIFESIKGKEHTIHTVISHDAPSSVLHLILGAHKPIHQTNTSSNLESLYNRLPNVAVWLFGHYHVNVEFDHKETHFRCLRDDGTSHVIIEIDTI